MLKNKKGITLIALVVTIVVLLILAGVSISLVLDNNGIIGKSKESRLETRASQVEDEIGLWKQNNFIKSETGESIENANAVLQSLLARKLLNEDEIDRENEIITIKRNDGSILKQIEYGDIRINISKTPATEKSNAVLLKVDSVEGMTTITNEDEYNNFINSLNEEKKKEIIKISMPKLLKKDDNTANCNTFEEALEYLKNQGAIEDATEDEFWNALEKGMGIDSFLEDEILYNLYLDKSLNIMVGYNITNPDNENSNTYIAKANGTYTFKVQDMLTGKTYTKKVEVTNIGENDKYYIANIKESEIRHKQAKVITKLAATKPIKLAEISWWCVVLREKETNALQTFETAYIIYNNQKIDISSVIKNGDGYSYINGGYALQNVLGTKLNDFDENEFYGSEKQFIIEKNGVFYIGNAKVCNENN